MDSTIGLVDPMRWFEGENKMGYLKTSQPYSESQLQTILDTATYLPESTTIGSDGEERRFVEFNYDRAVGETFLYLIWDYRNEIIAINADTKILIYFDNSGSMATTEVPLNIMVDTLLKDRLLPLYDNDEIAMVFQDEANSSYHNFTIEPRTDAYDEDLLVLRNRLNTFSENYYRAVVFQVEGFPVFKTLMSAIQSGTGSYSGVNGLSDRQEFNYKYDITDGGTPEYYLNQIVTALTELGYEL